MNRSTWILALLLAGSLLWAYRLAHPPKDQPSAARGSVEVWRIDPADVTRIVLKTEKGEISLEPEPTGENEAPLVWVWAKNKPKKRRPGHRSVQTKGDEDKNKAVLERFKGNVNVEKAVKEFAAFRARRRIGELATLEGEEFGLPTEENYLIVERSGEKERLRLDLGGYTFGKTHRYVHDPRDGMVYLIRAATFSNFTRGKPRLIDRRMLSTPAVSAERVELRIGQNTVMLWKLPGEEGNPQQWATDPNAEEGDEQYREWISTADRLRVSDYLPPEEEQEGSPQLEAWFYGEHDIESGSWIKLFGSTPRGWRAISSHTRHSVIVDRVLATKLIEKGGKILTPP